MFLCAQEIEIIIKGSLDDSYSPLAVYVMAGNTMHSLECVRSKTRLYSGPPPDGRISIKIDATAFMFQLVIAENYNGGRDTHVRSAKFIGPRRSRQTASSAAAMSVAASTAAQVAASSDYKSQALLCHQEIR